MISPFVFALCAKLDINPYFVLILLSLVGPLMSTFLRETKGCVMKD
jgi:hypothetical protein